jgi:hypothetical protein
MCVQAFARLTICSLSLLSFFFSCERATGIAIAFDYSQQQAHATAVTRAGRLAPDKALCWNARMTVEDRGLSDNYSRRCHSMNCSY